MNISLKKVYSNNYKSKFWLTVSVLLPIFGIITLLSVYGILPKFPLTEDMTTFNAILIMLGCIGISIIGIFVIRSTITNLRNIISNGELVDATITDRFGIKHQAQIYYEFMYEGEKCKGQHNIALKMDYFEKYAKGNEIKIYALKDRNGKILTVPDIY